VERPFASAVQAVVLRTQVAAAGTHHSQAASGQGSLVVVLVEQIQEVDLPQDLHTQPGSAEVSKADLTEAAGVVLSA